MEIIEKYIVEEVKRLKESNETLEIAYDGSMRAMNTYETILDALSQLLAKMNLKLDGDKLRFNIGGYDSYTYDISVIEAMRGLLLTLEFLARDASLDVRRIVTMNNVRDALDMSLIPMPIEPGVGSLGPDCRLPEECMSASEREDEGNA